MKAIQTTVPAAGAMVKQEFNGSTLAQSGSIAAEASIAAVRAQVEARCVMALRNPRDWDLVRQRLLKACDRPGFAESAIYTLPWAKDKHGKPVQGLSIRFAEEAMRSLGNLYPQSRVIYEDGQKRIVSVSVTDLEANVTVEKEVVIEKTVERSSVREGQVVLGERVNSVGKKTFLIVASEGELTAKQGSAESKAMRTALLRILPGDLQDEAWLRLEKAALNQAAADPSAEKKKMLDAFVSLGVTADEVKNYVGHSLDQLAPKELVELRRTYNSVHQGEVSWAEALAAKLETRRGEPAPTEAPTPPSPPASAAVVDAPPVQPATETAPAETKTEAVAPPPPMVNTQREDLLDAYRQLAQAAAKSPRLLATIAANLSKREGADAEYLAGVKAEYERLAKGLK